MNIFLKANFKKIDSKRGTFLIYAEILLNVNNYFHVNNFQRLWTFSKNMNNFELYKLKKAGLSNQHILNILDYEAKYQKSLSLRDRAVVSKCSNPVVFMEHYKNLDSKTLRQEFLTFPSISIVFCLFVCFLFLFYLHLLIFLIIMDNTLSSFSILLSYSINYLFLSPFSKW